MSQYFPEPHERFGGGNVKVELLLSSYATKADLDLVNKSELKKIFVIIHMKIKQK